MRTTEAKPAQVTITLPASIAGRALFQQDRLHLSEELKGNEDLDLLLARLDRCVPKIRLAWHEPAEFERCFGIRLPKTDPAADASLDKGWAEECLHNLLQRAVLKKASDIHIQYTGIYTSVTFRCLGLMLDETVLSAEQGLQLVRALFQGQISQAEGGFSVYERQDGRIAGHRALPEGVYAVRLHTEPLQSACSSKPGVILTMRLLFDSTHSTGTVPERLETLGFTREQQLSMQGFCEKGGMTIISGPTGHGKTTVLKNVLESMAESVPTRSYYSLEDPPEYPVNGVRQLNVSTRSSSEEERRRTFMDALAGLMRADPDVILLGEIRYREAAQAAVQAALTGHSVWTTVHAGSALGIISRLREMGVSLHSLCDENVLTGLTYQRLLPILCPHCRLRMTTSHKERKKLPAPLLKRLKEVFGSYRKIYLRGPGCPHCNGVGLIGQKVAAEVVPLDNPHLRSLLSQGKMQEAYQYWTTRMHGQTYLARAREMVLAGQVDPLLCEERLGTTLDADLKDSEEDEDILLAEASKEKSCRERAKKGSAKDAAQEKSAVGKDVPAPQGDAGQSKSPQDGCGLPDDEGGWPF